MLEIGNAIPCRFFIVMTWAEVETPTVCVVLNANEAGETVTGALPVPLKAIDWVVGVAFEATVTDPVRAPVAVGLKVVLMVQAAPAASEVPQLLLCAKSPVVEIFEMASAMF
jgi:hypothetical protein